MVAAPPVCLVTGAPHPAGPGGIPVERHEGADTSAYERQVPLGRMSRPEDVAGAVDYLLSDAPAFVTGQVLTVNGGHTL